jgi:hypothetical protein
MLADNGVRAFDQLLTEMGETVSIIRRSDSFTGPALRRIEGSGERFSSSEVRNALRSRGRERCQREHRSIRREGSGN